MEFMTSWIKEEAAKEEYNKFFKEINEKTRERKRVFRETRDENGQPRNSEEEKTRNEAIKNQIESEKKIIALFDKEKVNVIAQEFTNMDSFTELSKEMAKFSEEEIFKRGATGKEGIIFGLLLGSVFQILDDEKVREIGISLNKHEVLNEVLTSSTTFFFHVLEEKLQPEKSM